MDAIEIGKTIIESGLAFALASVVIYWYREDSKERLRNAETRSAEAEKRILQEREDKILLVEIVRANTHAMTRLESAILVQERREVRRDGERSNG